MAIRAIGWRHRRAQGALGAMVAVATMVVAVVLPAPASADPPPPASTYPACQDVDVYPFPEQTFGRALTATQDGSLWFPMANYGSPPAGTNLGRFDTATGTYSFVAVPDAAHVGPLFASADGALWMGGSGGADGPVIIRYDPVSGSSQAFALPTSIAFTGTMTVAPDGDLWFVAQSPSGANDIGRLDPSTGAITQYPTPKPSGELDGMTTGADGNLWVADSAGNALLKVNPFTAQMTSFPLPISGPPTFGTSGPASVVAGYGGGVWFSQEYAMHVGRIDPATGEITEVPAGVTPVWLTNGSDTAVWFSDMNGEGVGRIDPATQAVTECSLGYQKEIVFGIATGSDGNLWVAEQSNGDAGVTAIVKVPIPRTLTATGSFVTAAYWDFLGRLPSATERSTAAGQLDGNATTPAGFVTGLALSPAWVNRIVTGFYHDTLGREPDSGGLGYWTGQITSGAQSVAQVAAQFYASPEYYSGIGGGTASSWVTDLYRKILHRAPDADGLDYWVGQVAANGRGWVASQLYQSRESRQDRVAQLYRELLQRNPDPAGLAFWSDQILTSGDLSLAIQLAASPEYAATAANRFH